MLTFPSKNSQYRFLRSRQSRHSIQQIYQHHSKTQVRKVIENQEKAIDLYNNNNTTEMDNLLLLKLYGIEDDDLNMNSKTLNKGLTTDSKFK